MRGCVEFNYSTILHKRTISSPAAITRPATTKEIVMKNEIDVTRLKRLMHARAAGVSVGITVEEEVSNELIAGNLLAKDADCRLVAHADSKHLTVFRACEVLGEALEKYLPVDYKGKYDPKFAPARTVIDLWKLRQLIDLLGLPYELYVATAAAYVGKPKGRAPRLSQLMHRDVIAHVAREWSGKP
jgi:hypothetical protein